MLFKNKTFYFFGKILKYNIFVYKKYLTFCVKTINYLIVHGEIRTAIGLARLLMNQKLKQFKGLIDDSEFSTGEKEVTCSDLEGFWDMVHYEVRY